MRVGIAVLLLAACASCADWGYTGMEGPDYWASLDPAWAECTGQRQSPIDIQTEDAKDMKNLEYLKGYHHVMPITPEEFVNNGHTLQLGLSSRGVYLASSNFPKLMHVKQMHFHSPSEHTIDGKHYPLEVHFVSQTIDAAQYNGRAPTVVIGVLYQESTKGDALLEQLRMVNVSVVNDPKSTTFAPVLEIPANFYVYEGSFTTPPCSEIVHWMVSTEIRDATAEQIGALADLMVHNGQGNNRPPQPLNGRNVKKISTVGNHMAGECKKSMKGDDNDGDKDMKSGKKDDAECDCQQGGSRTYINFNGMIGGTRD